MKKAVVILPTYNERENIDNIIRAILEQQTNIKNFILQVLVVDDSSPDGTGELVQRICEFQPNVFLITGKKNGLGAAYIRGFQYAMRKLNADVVFEMDADFSHNPTDIPYLLQLIDLDYDFVIGSRYIPGGSIPKEWPLLRKLNSKWGNIFARYIAGLTSVNDCTSGFRAIKTNVLKRISLKKLGVKGYAFQISLLHEALQKNAKVVEFPIDFQDRVYGESKIRIKDITEFITCAFKLRFPVLQHTKYVVFNFLLGMSVGFLYIFRNELPFHMITTREYLMAFIAAFSIFMAIQMMFTLYWMIYAWENPERIEKNKSPRVFEKPKLSFSAIIPVRHEEKVIGDTIRSIANTNYPNYLKEILVVCRTDDTRTIQKIREMIARFPTSNIQLILFNDYPINKPHSLNIGLNHASKDVVVVFDAEDEPHKDIYHIVNTLMIKQKADVVQSGVQLMNYRSTWFSSLNVLEYFFWFKSALHWFARLGAVPLGGNTVFFKRKYLHEIDGWDETLLTEDADIGIRLSLAGANIKIVYDEQHVTREETPATIQSFIKQRTRWNQGFMQVFMEGMWAEFPSTKQKLLSMYILLWPFVQAILLIYLPLSIFLAFTIKLPIIITIIAFIPVYLLLLQMVIYIIGLYEFTHGYKMKFPFYMPLLILLTFYPYQLLLGFSAMRAIIRLATNSQGWEKTLHLNAHRKDISVA